MTKYAIRLTGDAKDLLGINVDHKRLFIGDTLESAFTQAVGTQASHEYGTVLPMAATLYDTWQGTLTVSPRGREKMSGGHDIGYVTKCETGKKDAHDLFVPSEPDIAELLM
jgi:hypothetical protein